MKKIIKLILRILPCVLGILALFMITMTIYHHAMLSKEAALIRTNSPLVSVDGHKIHIYAEGEGKNKPTIVVMSGSGIAAPVYDYKVLYSKLSDKYRVTVLEKFGYGYSEVSGLPRDIATLVKEDREALKASGEKGPYVLLPHSMSGLEALYWAQNYPGEISAIVGLDMALPEFYEHNPTNLLNIKLARAITFMGLHRIPAFDPVSKLELTEAEISQHKYLVYRTTLNDDVFAECKIVNDNAKKVHQGGIPSIPMLLFSSNGNETGASKDWVSYQRNFAKQSAKIQLVELDCGHMLHHYKSDYISQKIKEFLK